MVKRDMMKRDAVRRDAIRRDVSLPLALAMVTALAACGVETATTAATGAAIKKQEVDAGKKTLEQAQQKIDKAMEQTQSQARKAGDADAK